MPDNRKRKTLIFFLVTVILTFLVAAALPRLDLQPGTPLPAFQGAPTTTPDQPPQTTISISTFLKAVLGSILVLVLGYFIYQARKGLHWKEILLPALVVGILTMLALYILFAVFDVHINFDFSTPDILPPAVDIKIPPLGAPPAGLLWLVWVGLALVLVFLGLWLIWWRTRPAPLTDSDSLESEAQQALQALISGADMQDVILRCYAQMSRILLEEQKLELKQSMTAREFERLLAARGFPAAPVHQLTRLFENARYGHRPPGPGEQQQAYDCLHAIVQYSHLSAGSN